MFLAATVILSVVIAALCASARKARLPVMHRFLHIRYVITTVIFSIAATILFPKLLMVVNGIFSIPLVRRVLQVLIPSANVPAGVFWFIALFCCVLLMSLYAAVMHFLKAWWLEPLSKKNYLETNNIIEKFFNRISEFFYCINGDRTSLPAQNANIGQFFRVMRIIFAGILILEALFVGIVLQFGLTFIPYDAMVTFVKATYMIPVISYIILEQVELYFAADLTKKEALTDTEHIDLTMTGDYTKLVELYEKRYGGNALIRRYKGNGKSPVQEELFRGIQEEQKGRVKDPVLLEALCRNIESSTPIISHYVNGLVDLVNGKHIAVYDSLWGDFDPYYLAYIQHRLVAGGTALVICRNETEVGLMKKRFARVFTDFNIGTPLWRIRDEESIVDGETDVYVCTEAALLNDPIIDSHPQFVKKLSVVVVLDPYGIICREEAYFSRIFDQFAANTVQYVFYLPENNTDIRNELQSRLDNKPVSLCENPYHNPEANMLLWRSESVYKPQEALSDRLFHDFGVAYAISAAAAKFDVPHVNILAPESVAADTHHNLVTREYAEILLEDYFKDGSVNLSSVIHKNDYGLTDVTPAFNIVYDEYNNLINVAKTWLSYTGVGSSILSIVSTPYMLRDYFASKLDTAAPEGTGVQFFVPGDALNLRTPAIALLIQLRSGVNSERLLEFAKTYDLKEDHIEDILEILLRCAFGDKHPYEVYDCFVFAPCKTPDFTGEDFIYTQTVTLINEDLYEKLCVLTEEYVALEGHCEGIVPISRLDVYNHYLPKQCVVFKSRRYRIKSITDGRLFLEHEDTVDLEEGYLPVYDITQFTTVKEYPDHSVTTKMVRADFFEAKISRKTTAYFSFPGILNLKDKPATTIVELKTPIVETKTAPCLHITMQGKFENCSDKVANTLCRLLQGAMESFLPNNHKDLLIFTKPKESILYRDVLFREDTGYLEDPIPSDLLTGFDPVVYIDPALKRLVPEIAGDTAAENTDELIHIYIAHYSEIDVGVLNTITAELDRIWLTLYRYLTWVEGQSGALANYLKFGYEKTPKVFDPVATLMCLESIVPVEHKSTEHIEDLATSSMGCCSFCGKPLVTVKYDFGDGRTMCTACHNHITDNRKEIKVLLEQARSTLESHYGITLPSGIRVKFKSAASIRKASGISTGGRVLGFYHLKRREIWVERGGPEPCVLSTLVHELTHAWQHANLDFDKMELKIIEGHSSYVEVEILNLIGQSLYANFLEKSLLTASDEYGEGYRFWKNYLKFEADKNIFNNIIAMYRE